ncbi:hypothetical protein [Enterocloster clostridioformis]|uniref:Uncharacterized protein n=1 Tax=Enterocloster clostridioformis TaxID=1531 RepID=A0A174PNT9_9FIRM|nr:hypothetical protein [Enterocloster clostridioformis]CUP60318.1 Uncharacterised protein [Enterocloster clostridioformis]SEU05186.1 hypothetical protein SAMN05216521_10514 [Enterocloster clostridioformis]SEW43412.1 hypothetical protein SAMN05216528_10485 [Enterocloster clostridioformis]
MAKRKRSKMLDVARTMPPLRHSIPGKEFNIKNSEVVKWLLENPVVWNYVWNNVKESGAVSYDSDTGKWQGVDYDD